MSSISRRHARSPDFLIAHSTFDPGAGGTPYSVAMSKGTSDAIDANELMSSGEIAEHLGWQNSGTAATLAKRGTFPHPVIDKPRARLWRRADVLEWERTAHRRPGRRSND